jgi:HEAT repeat protein
MGRAADQWDPERVEGRVMSASRPPLGPSPDKEAFSRVRAAAKNGDVTTLVGALSDEALAPTAAKYLAGLRATSAAPELIRRLGADNPYVRAAAAVALGKMRVGAAFRPLRELSESDPTPFVRAASLEAALEIADQDTVHGLAAKGLGDEHWQPRFVAAQALGRRGDPEDLAALRVAKDAEVWWRRGAYRKAIRQVRRRSARRR